MPAAAGRMDQEQGVMIVYREPYSGLRWGFQHEAVWRPPTDVFETDDRVVVVVEIAGLHDGDYEISLIGRALIISGERRDRAGKLAYQQMEIRYGKFRTQIHLPWPIESTGIDVSYENGLLKVALQKALARRIPIQVGEGGEKDNKDA